MDIREHFKKVRVSLGLSQPAMSDRVGLSRNAWQSYELGKSTPGTSVYQCLVNLGVSVDWLLTGTGTMMIDPNGEKLSGYSLLPLYHPMVCIHRREGDNNLSEHYSVGEALDSVVDWMAFKTDWLGTALRTSVVSLAMLLSEGDSMSPTFNPGDLLMVDHSKNRLAGDGIYVLELAGNHLVKRIQLLMDGSVKVISDNSSYATLIVLREQVDALRIAGRVVWHGKKV